MPEITFSEIEYGWAETTFDFGPEQQVTISISHFSEPFLDLLEMATAVLNGHQAGMIEFTDEYDSYILRFEKSHAGFYSFRMERWHPWSTGQSNHPPVQTGNWEGAQVDPWHFGFQIWSEISRIHTMPGVMTWIYDDDEGGPNEGRWNRERAEKLAALHELLMSEHLTSKTLPSS